MIPQKSVNLFATYFSKRDKNKMLLLIFGLLVSASLSAQGGTHPGFDPDFGMSSPIENLILLGLLVIGALVAIFIKRKKTRNK